MKIVTMTALDGLPLGWLPSTFWVFFQYSEVAVGITGENDPPTLLVCGYLHLIVANIIFSEGITGGQVEVCQNGIGHT